MKDKGGRRRIADRRQYAARDHFPERRATRFRRSGLDRRKRHHPLYTGAHDRRHPDIEETKDVA